MTKDVFDAVNVYIIPKPQLQRCILTVNVMKTKIVGYPVKIDSQRYARNAFYFNLCFVCDFWARSVQYEPVVKKLSEYLVSGINSILLFQPEEEEIVLRFKRPKTCRSQLISWSDCYCSICSVRRGPGKSSTIRPVS